MDPWKFENISVFVFWDTLHDELYQVKAYMWKYFKDKYLSEKSNNSPSNMM